MAHISLDTIRKRLKNGGANEESPEQSTEESLQPLGSDNGVGTIENFTQKEGDDGRVDTKTPEQSTEESLQPLGSDNGVGTGELERGDGAGGQQTDTANDVAGSSNVKTKAKSKNRAK